MKCPNCHGEAVYDPEEKVWQCQNANAACFQMRFEERGRTIHVVPADFAKFVKASQSS